MRGEMQFLLLIFKNHTYLHVLKHSITTTSVLFPLMGKLAFPAVMRWRYADLTRILDIPMTKLENLPY